MTNTQGKQDSFAVSVMLASADSRQVGDKGQSGWQQGKV